jgi:hypothetical protein
MDLPAGLKGVCIAVAAFGASMIAAGLLFIVMLWAFETFLR